MPRPPLRAVIVILVGWIGLRAWMLWPGGELGRARQSSPVVVADAPLPLPAGPAPPIPPSAQGQQRVPDRRPIGTDRVGPPRRSQGMAAPTVAEIAQLSLTAAIPARALSTPAAPPATPLSDPGSAAATPAVPSATSARRWSGWAYLFYRPGGGRTLAAGGQLGGSQAAARLAYRIDNVFSIAARAYAPLGGRGDEAAGGIDAKLGPIHAIVERRVAIDPEGRDAWSAYLTGGLYREIGPVIVDAYAQAGVVGTRRRDAFVDGAARAGVRVGPGGPVVGAAAWGAAQPGARRIDVGPRLAWTEPHSGLTASIDGRFRVAGKARPGSGIALTLARDF